VRNDISAYHRAPSRIQISRGIMSLVKIRENFEESQFPSLSSSRSRETAREIPSGSTMCCVVPPSGGTGACRSSSTRNLALMRGRARANRAISGFGVLPSRSSPSNSRGSNLRPVSARTHSQRPLHRLVISQPSSAV